MSDKSTPKILIIDLVGLAPGSDGRPDCSAVKAHVEKRKGRFHERPIRDLPEPEAGVPHFYYLPMLSKEDEILSETADGRYDAVIAAATVVPANARFSLGGVRIGAGTGNMRSLSWGGGDGKGGVAPLMNTPGINARATAQMVMKALLRVRPDLPVERLHELVSAGRFDTGRDLADFPTAKLEGQAMAVIGYGNIGREVALLARAFGMDVRVHARPRHRAWIESEGFTFASKPVDAARDADVLSVHVGLGALGSEGYANADLVGDEVLSALATGATLINFDRGELVDAAALDRALVSGHVANAAIDADLFSDPASGDLSGPMTPYLPLLPRHAERLLLLPHAAADTDHPTRVAGAIQAVDQILDAIQNGVVRNLKGDLPAGIRSGGGTTPKGLGGVSSADLRVLVEDSEKLASLRTLATDLAAQLSALTADTSTQSGETLLLTCNRLVQALRDAGLQGPYSSH